MSIQLLFAQIVVSLTAVLGICNLLMPVRRECFPVLYRYLALSRQPSLVVPNANKPTMDESEYHQTNKAK